MESQLSGSAPGSQERPGNVLRGVGVSPGIARGRARVIGSVEDMERLEPGEILVVGSLEPTWTTAYARATGIVAERGAVLSHGAIVAREFGLPAVVAVPDALSCLRTGLELEVDGTAGAVKIRRAGSPRPGSGA